MYRFTIEYIYNNKTILLITIYYNKNDKCIEHLYCSEYDVYFKIL